MVYNCPKCQGAVYWADEELVKVIENVEPVLVVTKCTYVCKSCTDRFTRIHVEEASAKRKSEGVSQAGSGVTSQSSSVQSTQKDDSQIDTLRFF